MSYAIVRIQKFKASAVKGIQIHNHREKDSRTNPDIDKNRSRENYALIECPDYREAIAERLKSLKTERAVRKDAVVMAQVLVTSGPEFFVGMDKTQQQEFFRQSLDFIAERYGRKNILSAVIHMDEKTPYMHIDLTPIRDGHLTAKTIFTRIELRDLQTDFAYAVGNNWGLKRGESREDKKKHLTTEEYKLKAKKEELDEKRNIILNRINEENIFPKVTEEDLKAKFVRRKFFIKYIETDTMIVNRINEKFKDIKSIYELSISLKKYISVLNKKNNVLEETQTTMRSYIKSLEQRLADYEYGLSSEQRQEVLNKAKSIQIDNKIKERRRQTKEQEQGYGF